MRDKIFSEIFNMAFNLGTFFAQPTSSQPISEYSEFMNKLNYSINLMWINDKPDLKGNFICKGRNIDDMSYIITQIKKWNEAHPDASINLWFDSQRTNVAAINNTKQLVETISPLIQLKDIREIPFVAENEDFFTPAIPIYFIVDFLKLIIPLIQMTKANKTAVICTDFSIGETVEKQLNKNELFPENMFIKWQKFGMLLGEDTFKMENQFLQFMNTPCVIKALKHTINSILHIASNTLNAALEEKNTGLIESLSNHTSFRATLINFHIYYLAIQEKETIQIRADLVNEGTNKEWVTYEPLKHQYCLFGNCQIPNDRYTVFLEKEANISLSIEARRLLKNSIGAIKIPENVGISDLYTASPFDDAGRKDLNPGKAGSQHAFIFEEWPQPSKGKTRFIPVFLPFDQEELECIDNPESGTQIKQDF